MCRREGGREEARCDGYCGVAVEAEVVGFAGEELVGWAGGGGGGFLFLGGGEG